MNYCPVCNQFLINNTHNSKSCLFESNLHGCRLWYKGEKINEYYIEIKKEIYIETYFPDNQSLIYINNSLEPYIMEAVQICESLDVIARLMKMRLFS